MLPAGAPPLVSVVILLALKRKASVEMAIVAGFVAAVPPATVVLKSVLFKVTDRANIDVWPDSTDRDVPGFAGRVGIAIANGENR